MSSYSDIRQKKNDLYSFLYNCLFTDNKNNQDRKE